MADTVLKFPPDDKPAATAAARPTLGARLRARSRLILLVIVPLIAVAIGLSVYLSGGRYIETNNAYVGAPKVLITPDVSGKIARITVREGARVSAGDELVAIDAAPFEIAAAQAQARVAAIRSDFANLKSNLAALGRQIAIARDAVSIRQNDVDRKTSLVASRSVSPSDVDTANLNLTVSRTQLETLLQQEAAAKNQLLGNADLPIEQYPAYQQASAALDQAKRDLDHTVMRAPIAGIATQVDNVQLGRYVSAGTPILAVVDDAKPWVDANPKETDITYLKLGQVVTIDVDAFPNHSFKGKVVSVSPGTGAQFAILPPQNASGNWVKVVQRVPLRIEFAPDETLSALRSGMSANVAIDTGRRRSLAALLGLTAATAKD